MTVVRNLLTAFDDTLLAMSEVEGYDWLDPQLNLDHPWSGDYDSPKVLERLHQQRARIEEAKREDRDWAVRPDTECVETIYGSGGWNRWMVLLNGDVLLSGMHATREDRNRALELGFRIF